MSEVPVFVGVGGGMTNGDRSVRLAEFSEHQGASGVVVNAPISNETIAKMKAVVDIPVVTTIVSGDMDIAGRLAAGADILNVSGASRTPEIVTKIRAEFPTVPIIATGGPRGGGHPPAPLRPEPTPLPTPPTTGQLFADIMISHRKNFSHQD